jgi:hypothetical protein
MSIIDSDAAAQGVASGTATFPNSANGAHSNGNGNGNGANGDARDRAKARRLDSPAAHAARPSGELSDEHKEKLRRILPALIEARPYSTVNDSLTLETLGFLPSMNPALLIAWRNVDGEIGGYQIRPNVAPKFKGKEQKYLFPKGRKNFADVPPACLASIGDPKKPLWIVENPIRADYLASQGACAIGLAGVSGWHRTNVEGGKTAIACFRSIALNGRVVYICFDSDLKHNATIRKQAIELRNFLESKGARVFFVVIPDADNGEKQGPDDFINNGGTLEQLQSFAVQGAPRTEPKEEPEKTLSPDQIRAAFKSECGKSAPATLSEVVARYRKWMFVKDDGLIKVSLATFAANLCDGDPVWLMIVGGSSSGKTETISPLSALPYGRLVGTLTESSFLSGSPKRDTAKDASGGLLREVGSFGVLLFKDFTSILSIHHDKRISVLAALREIYDGAWTRDIGTDGGRKLEWRGKMGIIACCTDAIESAHAVSGAMGERFMRYRLRHDDDDQRAMTRQALRRVGRDSQMRGELEEAVTGFFGTLEIESAPEPLTEPEEDRLIAMAMLTAKARSVVDRDAKTRDIELTHDAEIPVRLAAMLRRVLHGLLVIGVPSGEAWAIVQKVALDSIPKLRAEIIRLVAHEIEVPSGEPLTANRIQKALKTSSQSARRALEELRAHSILDEEDAHLNGNRVGDWMFSELGAALWKEGFSPFPVKSDAYHTNGASPDSDLYKSPFTISTDLTGKGDFAGENIDDNGEEF